MIRSRGRSFWFGWTVLAAAVPACGGGAGGGGADSPYKPDLVLIVIDTLRPDHLELHGYERETAPFLAALAERSTVFDRAYSTSSWTAPATASVFTGMYPNRHGVLMGFRAQHSLLKANGEDARNLELVSLPAPPTLAEQLGAAGYATFGAASNVNVGPELGFDRGFDRFERLIRDDAELLSRKVLAWRDALEAGPSFLYVHFNDVHKPYGGREPFYEPAQNELEDVVARYDSEIAYLDRWIEHLYEELGWGADTVVVILSDHGEEFADHGGKGHGYSLYRELNHVLLLVFAPELAPGPARVEANVSLVDVLPTLLDAAGLDPFEQAQGRSLVPLLGGGGEAVFEQRTLFAHRIRGKDLEPIYERVPVWSVIRGRWKLIRKDKTGERELYDLYADPGEANDLAAERSQLVEELSRELAAFERETARLEGEHIEVEVDDELFEHLDELGYTGDDG